MKRAGGAKFANEIACYAERESSDLPDGSSPTGTTRAPNVEALLTNIGFRDREGARRHLTRALAHIPPTLAALLPDLLAESPDADSALLLFERLAGQSEMMCAEFSRQPVLAHYAILVFGYSRYLGETLFREPGLLQTLHAQGQLHRGFSSQEYADNLTRFRARGPERDLSLLLARFKKREYVRILLRDVLRIATLAETTAEISSLSDVLVEAALREAEEALARKADAPSYATPDGRKQRVPFAVLGLGKLGGNELNYSSDIDLLYLHGDGEDEAFARRARHEYFVRLAQRVTEVLSRVTEEGPVFRIDLRLRPQGRDGELAIGLSQALQYYRHGAEDWERQALLKARAVAGDAGLAREFIRGVQGVVYSRKVNFAAVKTALVSREKMLRHRVKPLAGGEVEGIDVKLDHGGIRDIEFLVQCLQRVYGGGEPWLRSGGTLFSLHKLHDKGHLSSRDFQDLTAAYEFLREAEHRLQLRYGQQTHRVPILPEDIRILERSLTGFGVNRESGKVAAHLRERMAAVSAIYKRVIFQQQARAEEKADPEAFVLRSTPIGTSDASTQVILERLAADAPELHELTIRKDFSSQVKRNLLAFLNAAFAGSGRYSALLRHAGELEKALEIFGTSTYLTDVLIRHPEEIATLAEVRGAIEGRGSEFLFGGPLELRSQAGDPIFLHLASAQHSESERFGMLRRHYRHRTLIEGVRDLTERRGVYNSLSALAGIADEAIEAGCGVVGLSRGFAVLALGSLGRREFDINSDADLLFAREDGLNPEAASRAAERLIQALAAYTQDGTVFPVDTRLRPRGSEGDLVLTVTQFEAYFGREAQAWEALTYGKLRFVAGDRGLAEKVIQQTRVLFERFSSNALFVKTLADVRHKLEGTGEPSLKNAPGGLYDIDYLTGCLLIQAGVGLKCGTMRDCIWRCADMGLMSRTLAATLDHGAELFRSVDHSARLVTGRSHAWLPANESARESTFRLAGAMLSQDPGRVEKALAEAHHRVRAAYEDVFGSLA